MLSHFCRGGCDVPLMSSVACWTHVLRSDHSPGGQRETQNETLNGARDVERVPQPTWPRPTPVRMKGKETTSSELDAVGLIMMGLGWMLFPDDIVWRHVDFGLLDEGATTPLPGQLAADGLSALRAASVVYDEGYCDRGVLQRRRTPIGRYLRVCPPPAPLWTGDIFPRMKRSIWAWRPRGLDWS